MSEPQNIKAGVVDRIFKSWKTTLIGSIIILGSLGMVYAGKATLTEAGAFIGLGIGAFFLKDN